MRIQPKKILVGCDFSPDSKLAFDYGLSLAQEFQAELHRSHVIKPSQYSRKREDINQLRDSLAITRQSGKETRRYGSGSEP
ncbi:MAG: universal stress protein [Desulfosarcina sp.]|nr:universal stress protein [Desulfosarcina sp.]